MRYSQSEQRSTLDGCFSRFVILCALMILGGGICLWILGAIVVCLTDTTGIEKMSLEAISLESTHDGEFTVFVTDSGATHTYAGSHQAPTGTTLRVYWRRHFWQSQDYREVYHLEGTDTFTPEEVTHFAGEPGLTLVSTRDGRAFRYRGLLSIRKDKEVRVHWSAQAGSTPAVSFIEQ